MSDNDSVSIPVEWQTLDGAETNVLLVRKGDIVLIPGHIPAAGVEGLYSMLPTDVMVVSFGNGSSLTAPWVVRAAVEEPTS